MSAESSKPPFESPVVPQVLTGESRLQFRCHKGIACFNECCRNIDITLAPYDILRMKQRLGMTSDEFLQRYTIPYEMDAQGMPGVKLKPVEGGTACQFMTEEGCSIYEDRPTSCRYYPLGLLSIRKADSSVDEQSYAMVQEEHCLGHNEDRGLSVDEYRQEQGLPEYDENTRGWRQLILKKKSAGPAVGKPSEMSMQLFFMASYHIDQFQRFVTSESFISSYDLSPELIEKLKTDQLEVILFGVRFLKQILFGEKTIEERAEAIETRVAHAKKKQEELREAIKLQMEADLKKAEKKDS